MMNDAYIFDAVRTPIGRYGGALAHIRTDDLAALPITELISRHPNIDASRIDDVIYGCANQAGEDNRNVARMANLLAGLPQNVPGATVNRLCGSGMDAVGIAARALKVGDAELMIAGGVESMSRAPFVMPKAQSAFTRKAEIYDTTIGWRFINPVMKTKFGVDSMPETAENVACEYDISRQDQDLFALRSQQRAHHAHKQGIFAEEIVAVSITSKSGEVMIAADEHPRADTTLEALANLPTPFKVDGTVTAGNAAGINDGACALLLGTKNAAKKYSIEPTARIIAVATTGVEPRIMGIGPAPASSKVLKLAGLSIDQMDVIEINEAFASQVLAVLRLLGLHDDASHVNPNGGAIALGHPLGMSGARLITTALKQLHRINGQYALCAMCIGVGQGIAMIIENTKRDC